MKKLLIYLKPYTKESIIAPLFKMLEACFDLFVPLVIAALIDTGIGGNNRVYVAKMTFLLVVLAIVGITCAATAQYFSARAAVGFATALRSALFRHLQGLSYTEIDTLGSSTMITRMTSDVNQMQTGVNMTLRLFLRSPFIVFGAMIMAFTIDTKAALVFVAAIVALGIIVAGIMKVSVPLMRRVQNLLDGITGATRENLTGVRVIRAFGQEEKEKQEFELRNKSYTGMQVVAGRVSALMNPLTYVVINLAVIWLIYTGAVQVNLGALTQGQVVALYNYMSQILVELVKFANLLVTINKAIACGNRIQEILDIESSMQEGNLTLDDVLQVNAMTPDDVLQSNAMTPDDVLQSNAVTPDDVLQSNAQFSDNVLKVNAAPAVRFNHVSLQYKGSGAPSLENIDFSAPQGSVVGVIGGTGAGKTSLVNLIPRFYDATTGSVEILGNDIRTISDKALRSLIGVVPQKAVLFKGSIRDNLTFGAENVTEAELEQAVMIAQAKDVLEAKGGFDAMIEQNGRNLSGGQRQRLTIARALVRKPRILILDDSASALDYATDAKLRAALKNLPESPTVFIVSQRTSSVRFADQILVLDDGQMVGKGTHEELLENCEVYQEIYYSQYPKKEVQA